VTKIGTRLHRFLFETERAAPLALVAEAAGGAASDGRRRILSVSPTANHERTPIYLGSKGDVERLEACVAATRER
jgi:fructose-1,6-bisphosphatase I